MVLNQLHDLASKIPLACHQLPERSFRLGSGAYFPVCARCTGVFAGQMFALVYILVRGANISMYFLLLTVPLLLDWLVQYTGLRESTNMRRVITGAVGGFGLGVLYYSVAVFGVEFLVRLAKLI